MLSKSLLKLLLISTITPTLFISSASQQTSSAGIEKRCNGGACQPQTPVIQLGLAGLQHDAHLSITTQSQCGDKVTVDVLIDVDGDNYVSPLFKTPTPLTVSNPAVEVDSKPNPSSVKPTTMGGSSSSATGTTIPASAYTPLYPAPAPGVNVNSPQTLVANSSVQMFYQHVNTTASDSKPAYALITIPTAQYPVVVLDNSALVVSIVCDPAKCTLTFATVDALRLAAQNWQNYLSGGSPGVLLVTSNVKFVGNIVVVDRAYLLITSFTVIDGKLQILGAYTLLVFEDIVHPHQSITVDIGHGLVNQTGTQGVVNGAGSTFNTFTTGTGSASSSGAPGGAGKPSNTTVGGPFTGSISTNSTLTNGTSTNGTSTGCAADIDFDVCLDDRIGYMSNDNLNFNQLFPGIDDDLSDYVGDDNGTPLSRRDISLRELRRRWSFRSFVNKIVSPVANAVKNVATNVATTVAKAATTIGNGIKDGVTAVYKTLNPFESHDIHPFTKTISLDISSQKDQVTTKWGRSNQLYSAQSSDKTGSIQVFCVECGVSGTLVFDSQIVFSIAGGISKGALSANGKAHAGFGLGIVATYSNTFKPEPKQLAAIPLSPLSIPGIINLGPQLSLSVGSELTVDAQGDIYAGISLDWPTITNQIDLLNTANSVSSGWTPQVDRKFDASGRVKVTAGIYTLLTFEVAVDILSGKFKQSVSLNDKPEVRLSAEFAASTTAGGSITSCNGVNFAIGLQNSVFVGVKLGTSSREFPIAAPYQGPSYEQCVAIPGLSAATPTTSSDASPSTPTTDSDSPLSTPTSSDNAQTTPQPDSPASTDGKNANTRRQSEEHDDVHRRRAHRAHHAHIAQDMYVRKSAVARADSSSITTSVTTSNASSVPTSNAANSASSTATSTSAAVSASSSADATIESDYAPIASLDNTLTLQWGDNGNIYVIPNDGDSDVSGTFDSSTFFSLDDGVVFGDADARLLHAYVDTLDTLGVSRIRLASEDKMPLTSVLVSLARVSFDDPSTTATDDALLMAVTSAGDYYYPIVCVYKGTYAKLFIAKDPDAGAAVLERNDLQATLTGGQVDNCGFVSFLDL